MGTAGTVLHWDGVAWRAIDVGTYRELVTVWASGPADVWIAGWFEPGALRLIRFDGARWTPVAVDINVLAAPARSVWGTGPRDVWVTTLRGLSHWDGTSWTPSPAMTTAAMRSVGGSGLDDVWGLAGDSAVFHFDGTGWTSQPAPGGARWSLYDLFVAGAHDAWLGGPGATAYHWDGSTWTPVATGFVGYGEMTALGGTGRADVWASISNLEFAPRQLLHWDGASWTASPSALPLEALSIAASAADDVWAVGAVGATARYDGTRWTLTTRGFVDPTASISAVWGARVDEIWAVGQWAPDATRARHALVLRRDAADWTQVEVGALPPLAAVWGAAPDDVWAVGASGTVIHWDGAAWAHVSVGVTSDLAAVWGSGARDIWLAGTSPTGSPPVFVHFDGATWSTVSAALPPPVPSVESYSFTRLWGTGADDVWAGGALNDSRLCACGPLGRLLHWDGRAWSQVTYGPPPERVSPPVTAVWGSGPRDVWAAAGDTAYHWDGAAWAPFPAAAPGGFAGLWGSGPTDVWGVGDAGAAAHWDGRAWTRVPIHVSTALAGVWGVDSCHVWMAGAGGAVLEFAP